MRMLLARKYGYEQCKGKRWADDPSKGSTKVGELAVLDLSISQVEKIFKPF